jgi:hypothetical protein
MHSRIPAFGLHPGYGFQCQPQDGVRTPDPDANPGAVCVPRIPMPTPGRCVYPGSRCQPLSGACSLDEGAQRRNPGREGTDP